MSLRERFTKWYYRKGYRMKFNARDLKLNFICPFWVKPLAGALFSPHIYYHEMGVEMYV